MASGAPKITFSGFLDLVTPRRPYHVQAAVNNPKTFPHHESISALWETKWSGPCSTGIYPFDGGKVEDFIPIVNELIKTSGDQPDVLYDPEAFAKPFMSAAVTLVARAEDAEKAGSNQDAKDLFMRAAVVYRIARFPIPRSPLTHEAWLLGKAAYQRGARYLDPPNLEVSIPFRHKDVKAGDIDHNIEAYLRVPKSLPPRPGWPVALLVCGLDSYRTDYTGMIQDYVNSGFATLAVEIPGTGDCPAAAADPTSSDRLFSSLITWITVEGRQLYAFDPTKIVARGLSTGSYHVLRLAHTHANYLQAAIVQGGGCHDMFDPEWIAAQNHMEYPFALADAIAYKLGYRTDRQPMGDVVAYKQDDPQRKWGLLQNGILDLKCCRTLITNGWDDSVFPIEDSLLAASHGRPKDVRLIKGAGHMGRPAANDVVLEWLKELHTM